MSGTRLVIFVVVFVVALVLTFTAFLAGLVANASCTHRRLWCVLARFVLLHYVVGVFFMQFGYGLSRCTTSLS